jgi:hypothetical protein
MGGPVTDIRIYRPRRVIVPTPPVGPRTDYIKARCSQCGATHLVRSQKEPAQVTTPPGRARRWLLWSFTAAGCFAWALWGIVYQ